MSNDTALERLADAILIPPFPGTTAPRWLLDALYRGLAGVTLFAPNMAAGPETLTALTRSLHAAAPDLVVATDEEGGDVTRVWYDTGSPYPGNAALGAVDDVELTERVHAAIGADLAALGINLDLAPCLDVLSAADNPVVGTRSFGADPALVARHGAAAVRGLQSAGVAACAKHFPGHGATLLDSHFELAVVPDGLAVVEARDLPPFRAALAVGVLTVMPGHLRVAGLTGDLPASLSAAAISLLRATLKFDGVVVSDALEMRAVSDAYGIPGAAVRAVLAGNDLLCLGRDVPEEGYLAVRAALRDAVRSGELPAARLEEAAARVAALRARLARMRTGPASDGGAGDSEGVASTARIAATPPADDSQAASRDSGSPAGRTAIGLVAARRALRVTGARPELRDPMVVEVESLPNMAAGEARWGLASWAPTGGSRRVPAAPDPARAAAIALKAAAGRSLVLVVRDAHRSLATQHLVTAVLAERPDTVLVEMGLPFWRPPDGTCQTYLATFGASRANAQAAAEFLGLTALRPVPRQMNGPVSLL
ncbi:MAG TPA: glycoside hydrolase family 3 N-terminal domain-containing protein [Trebonia sp.]|nr:glycoside hydrolase family 3 N-terminal domain-containing protein [Trebonia sp.]